MSDDNQGLRRIDWAQCCGFTYLFRAFRLAISPTKLVLAFCGVLFTYGTGRVLDVVWPSSGQPAFVVIGGQSQSELDVFVQVEGGGRQATRIWLDTLGEPDKRQRVGAFKLLLGHGRSTIREVTGAVSAADPGGVVATVKTGVMGFVWLVAMHPCYGTIFLLATLVIWAFFGGAICRAVALDAAREEKIAIRESLAFARKKFLSFLAAPLMPVGVLAILAIPLYIGGWVGAIPAVGDILVGVFFFLAICAGFAMAFVAIGGLAGCSLTFPTIAVEGSDAFDALSRSFSYVYSRPWRTALYGLVSLVYGAICLLFVKFFVRIMLWAVHVIVGLSMNYGHAYVADAAAKDVPKLDAMWQGPLLTGGSHFWGGFGGVDLAHVSAFGRFWFYLWIFAVVGLVGAFIVSFYYSASTLIYCLLRREVDATDLEDVYMEEPPEGLPAPVESTAPVESPAPVESTAPPEQEEPEGTSDSEPGQTS
jgi:hypothetical protein